uniref:Uncharacterized protein n=1 Tax=Ditylenchus dipsaci TaxID=166011 RepID=A0A915CZM1_9BILA
MLCFGQLLKPTGSHLSGRKLRHIIKSVLGNSSSSLCPRFLVFENMQAKWRKKRMRRKLFYWNLKRKRRQSKK